MVYRYKHIDSTGSTCINIKEYSNKSYFYPFNNRILGFAVCRQDMIITTTLVIHHVKTCKAVQLDIPADSRTPCTAQRRQSSPIERAMVSITMIMVIKLSICARKTVYCIYYYVSSGCYSIGHPSEMQTVSLCKRVSIYILIYKTDT